MKILLLEDDPRTAHYLRKGLVESGFAVDVGGLADIRGERIYDCYDLIVCDLNQESCVSAWIQSGRRQPVLFLADRKTGPERPASVSNCLYKPFAFADFLARVRSLLEVRTNSAHMALRVADLDLDLMRHRAFRDGMRLDLTPKEFLLLSLLMRRSGEVLSRAVIADQVWEINFDTNTNFVDVHIRRLRSKVDDPFPTNLIHTVRGMGYVLEDREERGASLPPHRSVAGARLGAVSG